MLYNLHQKVFEEDFANHIGNIKKTFPWNSTFTIPQNKIFLAISEHNIKHYSQANSLPYEMISILTHLKCKWNLWCL